MVEDITMQKHHYGFACAAALCLLQMPVLAQDTNTYQNLPITRLEAVETNTGTVIVRATASIGSVSANGGTLAVKGRDFTDAGSGRRELGISITISLGNQREDTLMIDYDELDSLLNGIDYLARVDWSVTSFPAFDALYTTKSGFRLVAFGGRRSGAIEYTARSVRSLWPSLPLSRDQLAQLRSLVEQARAKLDSVRKAK